LIRLVVDDAPTGVRCVKINSVSFGGRRRQKTAGFSALRGLMQSEKRIESTPSIELFRFRMKSLGESNERQ